MMFGKTFPAFVWALVLIVAPATAWPQLGGDDTASLTDQTFPQARPQDYGLDIPDGDPIPGAGRRVALVDLYDRFIVGRIHVEVGGKYIVLLPDGRLLTVDKEQTILTDRPFRPLSKEAILKQLTSTDFKGFQSNSTARFLYVYNTTENFATATSRILETMYPSLYKYCAAQGLDVHDPEFPLIVIMFRSREEFDRYRRMPPGVIAYYNIVTNHIVMYADSDLAKVLPEMAMKTSIATIAHEGVHQVLYNIGVAQRLSHWPQWISEGLPEYFAPTETGKRIRWKGLGLVNDMRMYHLVEVAKAAGGGGSQWFGLQQNILAQQLDALGYAKSWATVYVLAKNRQDDFEGFLNDVSRLGPLEEPPSPGTLFRKHFGDNMTELEEFIVNRLRKVDYVDPIENLTYYVGVVDTGFSRRAVLSPSPKAILDWRNSQVRVRGFTVRSFPNRRTAESYLDSL